MRMDLNNYNVFAAIHSYKMLGVWQIGCILSRLFQPEIVPKK